MLLIKIFVPDYISHSSKAKRWGGVGHRSWYCHVTETQLTKEKTPGDVGRDVLCVELLNDYPRPGPCYLWR